MRISGRKNDELRNSFIKNAEEQLKKFTAISIGNIWIHDIFKQK